MRSARLRTARRTNIKLFGVVLMMHLHRCSAAACRITQVSPRMGTFLLLRQSTVIAAMALHDNSTFLGVLNGSFDNSQNGTLFSEHIAGLQAPQPE